METDKDSWLKKEKEKWQKKAEVDLRERIQREQKEWEEKAELDVLERIQAEKVNRGVMGHGSWVKAVLNQMFVGGKG